MLLQLHIFAGGLAMLLGAIALWAPKGAGLHRRSGQLFVYAMLTMGITASVLGNVSAGLLPVYFVVTALTTVRPVTAWTRGANVSASVVAVVLVLLLTAGGVRAYASPSGVLNGAPFFMLFFLAAIMSMAVAGDVRVMRPGSLRGGPRLARHLWRMCFGLFIAAGSFFSIEARVATILPEPFTTAAMRALPVALVFIVMSIGCGASASARCSSSTPLPHVPRPGTRGSGRRAAIAPACSRTVRAGGHRVIARRDGRAMGVLLLVQLAGLIVPFVLLLPLGAGGRQCVHSVDARRIHWTACGRS